VSRSAGNALEQLHRPVYWLEYELFQAKGSDLKAAHDAVSEAVTAWKRTGAHKAKFEIERHVDGSATLTDCPMT